jgi:selenocysteine lyase/cysteine desulfurase
MYASAARQAVLDFFDGPPNEYVCIFTKDTSEALDLVAESYPFSERSSLVIPTDSSTSLMSIRRYAHPAGAEIVYLGALEQGGFDEYDLRVLRHLVFVDVSGLTSSGRR